MRPPQFAGENFVFVFKTTRTRPRFNEAPAIRGGKLLRGCRGAGDKHVASMRPPQFAGENGDPHPTLHRQVSGFNEAPAIRGGKHGKREI